MKLQLFSTVNVRSNSRLGYTLMEMLVAVACCAIVLAGTLLVCVFVVTSFRALGNYTDLDASSRHTLDVMSADIRSAAAYSLAAYATNQIVLTNQDGSSFSYSWNPNTTALIRYYTNASGTVKTATPLLTNCDILIFNIYQRNPTTNFMFYTTTNAPSLTKLIDVSWRCSRQIYGSKINTESVQTAKIAIRN